MRSQKPEAGRNEQLLRVLAILREMHRLEGVDLYELADRYGTDIRTIRRDLGALEAAGIPMEKERDGKRMKWRVAYKDKLASVASLLDVSHYLALKLAVGQGGAVTKASGVYAGLEDLGDKIENAVGSAGRKKLEAIEKYFYSYEKFPYRESAKEYFWPLLDAMAESRVCRVIYRPPRPKPVDASYEILPLRMFQHDRAVYLICQFMSHGSVGTLNLQRLRDLKVLDRKAQSPRDFDPAKYEASAFGIHPSDKEATYILRFHKAIAPYIRERVWHPSQKLRDLRGGGVELTFTCGESHEVTSWVASWRSWVEVLEPSSLMAELAELGRWLVSEYGGRRQPTATAPPRR